MANAAQEGTIPTEGAGEVRISADVIAIIAHAVTLETEGVSSMSVGIAENITGVLKSKSAPKGIRIDMGEKDVSLDLYIVVDFGARIPDVAWRIQERVKTQVESMTGMEVKGINIHVQGVNFDEKKAEAAEPAAN